MYDLHSHIIPAVDDGCKDLEMTLSHLKKAQDEGILGIITTPHYMHTGPYRIQRAEMLERYELLRKEIKLAGLSIEVYLGNEILANQSMTSLLDEQKISTLNNSRYVLVEFDFLKYQQEYEEYVYDLIVSGYKPIIAHVERYKYVQQTPQLVYDWIKLGCLCQVNQDSITGKNGEKAKEAAMLLIRHNQIHFVCSDAHRDNRTLTLVDAKKIVETQFSDEIAQRLFIDHAYSVIMNQEIVCPKPIKLVMNTSWLSRLFKGKLKA